jgi:hypothetical protein
MLYPFFIVARKIFGQRHELIVPATSVNTPRTSAYVKRNSGTITSMTPFVQIVVNVSSVTSVFDYAIPKSLEGQVGIGHLVIVPFGKQTVQDMVCVSTLLSLRSLRAQIEERLHDRGIKKLA